MRTTVPASAALVRGAWLVCVFALACESASTDACRTLPAACPAVVPSYATDIAPIFSVRCGSCHNPNDPSGPWPFDNHADVSGWRVDILRDIEDCSMPPPSSGMPLPEDERALLHAWLACGAPDN